LIPEAGKHGVTAADLAFLGALMMLRGSLMTLDDTRKGEGPGAIPLKLADQSDPAKTLCDFCGGASPGWYFPAEPFELLHARMAGPVVFGDRWYSCGDCKLYVDGADWRGLAAHLGFPWPLPETIRTAWYQFTQHRRGDAQRLVPEPE
jgi:hypothetical protein